jgi:hypothetical protein
MTDENNTPLQDINQQIADCKSQLKNLYVKKRQLQPPKRMKQGEHAHNAKPERNAAMFVQWKSGRKKKDIAAEFDVSPTRLGEICRKLERLEQRKLKPENRKFSSNSP